MPLKTNLNKHIMARSLPYSSCDELPILASQDTPVAFNKLFSTSSPRQANENHRKPRRWAEARSVDNIGNDWNLIKDFHLSQPPFRSKRSQQSSNRTFPSPGNSQLLSNTTVVGFNNRNLPALPKEEDFRPRANSFEYNDELRFSSSDVIRRHQYPSPPRKIAPQRCLSKIVKPQIGGKAEKSSVAHPDSLVPGRSGRRIDVTEAVFRSSAFQQRLDLNDLQNQRSHSSISSYTSPRTSNPSQKSLPFSKSYSHPTVSRDNYWGNTMIERPSTSGHNHVVTSASDKPLPFVPSKDNHHRGEESENPLNDEHCHREFFEIERSTKSSDQDHDHDEIEWKTTFLDSISEPNSNSNSIDTNHTKLPKPQLPNLSRISIFGTEIFSHLKSENLHTDLNDIQENITVKSDLKLLPLAESNFDSDTHHVSDKAAGPKTLLSAMKTSADNAEPSSSHTISKSFVTSSGYHNMASGIKSKDLNDIPEISLGETLQNTEEDNNRSSLDIEVVQSKGSKRSFRQDLTEKTTISTYDNGSLAIDSGKTQFELDSSRVSSNPLLASDHQITTKAREKEEFLDKPGLVSAKNLTVSNSALKREGFIKNDDDDVIPTSSLSTGILRSEKIQEPSELNDKSIISFSQEFLDPKIAMETRNNTTEKLEKFHSIAQQTSTNINSDPLPFDLKAATMNSAHEIGRSKKFQPPDHENISEARKSENSMYSELGDELTIDSTLDSTLESLSYYEDEKLQQDIVKSLNLHQDDIGDDLNQAPELLNSAEDHMSTYLPSEYDNYWASTTGLKRERYSVASTSQLSVEKKFEALSMEISEDNSLFVAPLSPERQNDSTLSRPQLSISTQYPIEDDSHFVSPISILSAQSDFICELQDNTPVSPISVISDSSARCNIKSDLNLANDSNLAFEKKTTSLDIPSQRDFKSQISSIDNFEKNYEEIDVSFTQTENACNSQYFLLDQDLSSTVQSTVAQLPKFGLHDISLEQNCTKKDLNLTLSVPAQCQSYYSTAPLSPERLPSFRETLTLKSSQQKIQTFDEMREIFANFDIGLDIWIRELKKKHSEYQNPTFLKNPSLQETSTNILSRDKLASSNYIAHSPHNEDFINVNLPSLPVSSNIKFNVRSNILNTQNIHTTNKLKSQQVQAKGKELFHTAGILSGKAGKAGKGLLAKGKNKLLFTGGGDKID